MTITSTAIDDYEKAYRLGKKENEPLPALDDILKEQKIGFVREVPLGLVQIPIDQIVGTKTAGRSSSFSKSFYPILKRDTEFAFKWISLYKAHLEEGIRDPIKVYEYMNKFYVQEGNKRVSVLKYFGAVSIPGTVIRIIPPRTGEKENRIYYEFLDFYRLSTINYIWFSQEGSFAKLQRLVGKCPDDYWTDDERLNFSAAYNRFSAEYSARKGEKEFPITIGDAFLAFIEIYDYQTLDSMTSAELKEQLKKFWKEFKPLKEDDSVELQTVPMAGDDSKKSLLSISRLIPLSQPPLQVAFIYQKTIKTSAWSYAHDLGRMHLEQTFGDQIHTSTYENADEQNADSIIEKAIKDGNKIIFTTSPILVKASIKAALEHPEVKILNCSLNNSHTSIRAYYARMYEAKFLMGAIAGAMSENGKIGYIADYPIFGVISNINAFALGAKMVNPRAKIYLEWSTVKGNDVMDSFEKNNIQYISGKDMIIPDEPTRHFGLYRADEQSPLNLAMPVWHWGKFYEQMIRKIQNGSWKSDDTSSISKGLNYWWGMSSGVIDVIFSKHLPIGTARLIDLLKETICRGDFNPFSGILYSQDGPIQHDMGKVMVPEDIITMDWLAENIIGSIPKPTDLIDNAIPVVTRQGIDNPDQNTL